MEIYKIEVQSSDGTTKMAEEDYIKYHSLYIRIFEDFTRLMQRLNFMAGVRILIQ